MIAVTTLEDRGPGSLESGSGAAGIRVQWCLIAESLNDSVHAKLKHGNGFLVRANRNVSFHHNLYADPSSRNPRPGTFGDGRLTLDFRNNVVYDWSSRAGYTAADPALASPVGNYHKPGPSTRTPREIFRIGDAATALWAAVGWTNLEEWLNGTAPR